MSLSLKTLAPWLLVVGIIVFALTGVPSFYAKGKRQAAIDRLHGVTLQLCSLRLARGGYPADFPIPPGEPALSRLVYRSTGPAEFLIEAELALTPPGFARLQARPQGVFLWSEKQRQWRQVAPPDPRCPEPR